MSIYEYDEEKHLKNLYAEGKAEGKAEGVIFGRVSGKYTWNKAEK